jgi:glycosyltransferase involved in cell wall biosynthesis
VWDCGGIRRSEKPRSAVMFEALGSGKPFIGTKVGGVLEIITSEDEPANPEELAEKILIALDKDWDSKKILKYDERFGWENIAKEILKIYGNLTRGGKYGSGNFM